MARPRLGYDIPFTVGIIIIIYTLFGITALQLFGGLRKVNLESGILTAVFALLPLLAAWALAMRQRIGLYIGMALPACFLIAAAVLRLLSARGIVYDRWYANYTHEYIFSGRDGMEFLAVLTFWSALILATAALLLFTPSARAFLRQRHEI